MFGLICVSWLGLVKIESIFVVVFFLFSKREVINVKVNLKKIKDELFL